MTTFAAYRTKVLHLYKTANKQTSEMKSFMELKNILEQSAIRIVFQPVVSLTNAEIIGYEALSRGPKDSMLERPDALFATAAKYDLVWELEYLCRRTTLEKAKDLAPSKMVFINVDPKIINDPRFQKGQTQDMLRQFQANTGNIIFEITEKTAIDDYKGFCRILDNYTSQGYKIAIDDTGSGYSGLRTLAEIRPNFIKVDMELVRDIDKDNLKQAMLKALYDFSVSTNSKIIAEGIETQGELATLISIGIPYGQGFFLQKPLPEFSEIPGSIKQIILELNKRKKRELYHTSMTLPVGEIAQQEQAFPSSTVGSVALDYFSQHPACQGITIVDDDRPVGLLMKSKFLANLVTQYGIALYMNRSIRSHMDKNPLIVAYDTPIEVVSKSALARKDDDIYDYIIITNHDKYFGTVTIKKMLEKTTQLELNRAKHANPLTGLPGNLIIEGELDKLLKENSGNYAVLYFDLDNFKAYNDVYGFERGDKVICFTAEVLQQDLHSYYNRESFLGHIGGDDFIAITRGNDVTELCERIISDFNHRIVDYYNQEDCNRGYICTKNRHGIHEDFPIMSLSIAVVTDKQRNYTNILEIVETASQLKKQCKLNWQSCYCIK